jgi:hypothetical protein
MYQFFQFHVSILIDVVESCFDTIGILIYTIPDTIQIRSDVVKKEGIKMKNLTMVNFSISSRGGTRKFEIKQAYAVDSFQVTPNFPISFRKLKSWTHLPGIDVRNVQLEDVTVLIGIDVTEVLRSWR